jgi:hypothetical protein
MEGVRYCLERIKQAAASPPGIFLYAALSGMIGIVILLAFFSMILSGSSLLLILQGIISFNAAASGYYLVDKGGTNFPLMKTSLIVISGLMALTGCFSLAVILPWELVVDSVRFLVSSLLALCFSFFGAWIAARSKRLENASVSQT